MKYIKYKNFEYFFKRNKLDKYYTMLFWFLIFFIRIIQKVQRIDIKHLSLKRPPHAESILNSSGAGEFHVDNASLAHGA